MTSSAFSREASCVYERTTPGPRSLPSPKSCSKNLLWILRAPLENKTSITSSVRPVPAESRTTPEVRNIPSHILRRQEQQLPSSQDRVDDVVNERLTENLQASISKTMLSYGGQRPPTAEVYQCDAPVAIPEPFSESPWRNASVARPNTAPKPKRCARLGSTGLRTKQDPKTKI